MRNGDGFSSILLDLFSLFKLWEGLYSVDVVLNGIMIESESEELTMMVVWVP